MSGLMNGFCTRRHWPALVGLMLALATGIAAFDTGVYSAPPVAAPWPDPSIDRLADAAQPPGATDPADHAPRPSGDQRERTTSAPPPSPVADPAATARIQQGYGRLPMHFEPNQGQMAEEVRYLARGAGYSLFLTDSEAVLVLRKPTAPAANRPEAGPAATPGRLDGAQRHPGLAGTPANPDPSVSGGDLPWPGFWHSGPTDGELPSPSKTPTLPSRSNAPALECRLGRSSGPKRLATLERRDLLPRRSQGAKVRPPWSVCASRVPPATRPRPSRAANPSPASATKSSATTPPNGAAASLITPRSNTTRSIPASISSTTATPSSWSTTWWSPPGPTRARSG